MTSDSPPRFAVHVERPTADAVVVSVTGDVDMGTAPEFEDRLAHAVENGQGESLVVDLTEVSFIDSTGLNALVRAFERQRLAGNSAALVSTDPRVAMILEVARLDRVLRRYPTRAEALSAMEAER